MPRASYNRDAARGDFGKAYYKNFTDEIEDYLASERPEIYAPPLRKGDVFFWGSRVIHGSVAGTNPKLRRRSIAAHFVPDGFKFGNLERDNITVTLHERYGLRYAYHEMDSDFEKRNTLAGRVRTFAGRAKRQLLQLRAS